MPRPGSARLAALLRRAGCGSLEGFQFTVGVREPPELAKGLRKQIVRFWVVGIELDRLLEPAYGEVASPGLHQRFSCEKKVPGFPGIALRRFGGEIERPSKIPELDQKVSEVGVDNVVLGMVLVNERDRFQVVLLCLGHIAERLGCEPEVVPGLVVPRIHLGRASEHLGSFSMATL